MEHFKLVSKYQPTGDQPQAIEALVKGFQEGNQFQTLLGVTGSGKTFTMANVIAALNKPTLIISHNKTLAAQLYGEFKEFFPENAVEYFVSYYDYYQPEAYVPSTDTYIAKDSSINEEIDKLRLSATAALVERKDVIVIASVSCIYGLGSPEDYMGMMVSLRPGMEKDRDDVIRALIDIQYTRNEMDFKRGSFRVRGDVLEVFPAYSGSEAYRIEFFGDEVDRIMEIEALTGEVKAQLEHVAIFPASHYVVPKEKMMRATENILAEMKEQVTFFKSEDKLLEAQRIAERTNFDVEMMRETGFCSGIENYSRHLVGSAPGQPPCTLLDYFPDDFLIIVDESHITLPQVRGMYFGDRSRKKTLVDYGFRLPSALDNRPLNFEEFETHINQMMFVSATPSTYEAEHELLRASTQNILYPGVAETMKALCQKVPLFIVSNCQSGYIELFLEKTSLTDCITDSECPGGTGLPKGPNIRLVADRNHLQNPVYVGDIDGDRQASEEAGVKFCHASYGFGKVERKDYVIKEFSDLMTLFE